MGNRSIVDASTAQRTDRCWKRNSHQSVRLRNTIDPMSSRYDLLVVDLDGTLLRSDGSVSDRNRQAVRRARETGMQIMIATGRSMVESRAALDAVDHQGLVVAAGGSLLCDTVTGRTVERRAMPADLVRDVTRWVVEHEHRALILKDSTVTGYDYLLVGECELDPASCWWFERMGVTVREAVDIDLDAHPHDSIRAGAVAEADRILPLANRLRDELGDRCFLQHWSAVTSSAAIGSPTHLLEVFDPNVSKWTMVAAHCERAGIDINRVAAIGDGLNDVELVANAAMGIAMANAGPEVRAVAKRFTAHHDADGVACAIERLLCGEW
jgi:HAD superfamily hydrolase (TIGR01484 family)